VLLHEHLAVLAVGISPTSVLVVYGDLLHGLLAVEQGGRLLQRAALGLDDEEVTVNELEADPAYIDDIILPSEFIQSDWVNVLVEDERKGDGKVEDRKALRANGVRQDLDGIRDNERGERNVVCSVVQENKRDDRVRSARVTPLREKGAADRLQGEENEHADAASDKHKPSPESLDEERG